MPPANKRAGRGNGSAANDPLFSGNLGRELRPQEVAVLARECERLARMEEELQSRSARLLEREQEFETSQAEHVQRQEAALRWREEQLSELEALFSVRTSDVEASENAAREEVADLRAALESEQAQHQEEIDALRHAHGSEESLFHEEAQMRGVVIATLEEFEAKVQHLQSTLDDVASCEAAAAQSCLEAESREEALIVCNDKVREEARVAEATEYACGVKSESEKLQEMLRGVEFEESESTSNMRNAFERLEAELQSIELQEFEAAQRERCSSDQINTLNKSLSNFGHIECRLESELAGANQTVASNNEQLEAQRQLCQALEKSVEEARCEARQLSATHQELEAEASTSRAYGIRLGTAEGLSQGVSIGRAEALATVEAETQGMESRLEVMEEDLCRMKGSLQLMSAEESSASEEARLEAQKAREQRQRRRDERARNHEREQVFQARMEVHERQAAEAAEREARLLDELHAAKGQKLPDIHAKVSGSHALGYPPQPGKRRTGSTAASLQRELHIKEDMISDLRRQLRAASCPPQASEVGMAAPAESAHVVPASVASDTINACANVATCAVNKRRSSSKAELLS
eukprot:TRINITY_DN24400_c0_g2_i1.p1 TRINITY_DN24400_c0_g2~~TRINITY_DN24400_c0_g2_i1.p1  ORF type:complete len:584 (-),score=99.63 TRINITY_DN24400_c0_g2_i1:388-2139(-)